MTDAFRDMYNVVANRRENPQEGSYTCYLFDKGLDKILKKCGEECTEMVIAAKNHDNDELANEINDLLYHMVVLMVENGVTVDDIEKIIQNSKNNGINICINAGCDKSTNEEVLSIKNDSVYAVIGYHPEFANDITEEDISLLEKKLNNSNVIGIGEIGLDYHYDGFNKEKQITVFEKQLSLAEKYNLPVVVHSRDAGYDTINILKKYKVTGVIHSFSGSLEMAKEYIKLGFYLGVNGVITFKNCKLIEVYKKIGIQNILFETDSPYLSPVPFRGKINFPGNIKYIAKFVSEILNISIDELEKITNSNVKKLFNISI